MMAMPIMVVASVKSVVAKNNQVRERTIIYEGSSGPRELLEGIAIQAQAAIKGLEGNKAAEAPTEELTEEQKRMTTETRENVEEAAPTVTSDENQKLLSFCKRILATTKAIDRSLREVKGDAFVERLHGSLPRMYSAGDESSQFRVAADASEESVQKSYMEWAKRVRFEYCDLTVPETNPDSDTTPHYKFVYDNEARMLASSDIPKRSLAIAKEVSLCGLDDVMYCSTAWNSLLF